MVERNGSVSGGLQRGGVKLCNGSALCRAVLSVEIQEKLV